MGIVEKITEMFDRFINPLKYETDREREERHRKENMQHQLAMERTRRTRFVEVKKGGSGGGDNTILENEFGWLTKK